MNDIVKVINRFGVKRAVAILVLVMVGMISFFGLSKVFSNPDRYTNQISYLDEKKETVGTLTAGTAAASTIITLIPGDAGTPVADKLADLSSWFIVVLGAIYLEKYALSLIGLGFFKVIIPLFCACMIAFVCLRKESLKQIGFRMLAFGLAIYIAIPAAVFVSKMIEETYQDSMNKTVSEIENITDEAQDKENQTAQDNSTENGVNENKSWYENLFNSIQDTTSGITDGIKNDTEWLMNKAKTMLNDLIEAIAIMIVTSCVIPVLVILFFIWLAKSFLNINITTRKLPRIRRAYEDDLK